MTTWPHCLLVRLADSLPVIWYLLITCRLHWQSPNYDTFLSMHAWMQRIGQCFSLQTVWLQKGQDKGLPSCCGHLPTPNQAVLGQEWMKSHGTTSIQGVDDNSNRMLSLISVVITHTCTALYRVAPLSFLHTLKFSVLRYVFFQTNHGVRVHKMGSWWSVLAWLSSN